jgi:pantetheine-phosphate adenylyltransferase
MYNTLVEVTKTMRITKKYKTIGLGGTFDHFHAGHEKFISYAADHGQKLIIGITEAKMTQHKQLSKTIQPYQYRVKSVKNFCQKNKYHFEISQLTDIYGPTLEKGAVHSLCVTEETIEGSNIINHARTAAGMRELPTFICEMFISADGHPLHSNRIREGSANRAGTIYLSHFSETIKLTDEQRELLREPLGNIVEEPTQTRWHSPLTCLVGDQTLANFLDFGWKFDLAIFDGLTGREEHHLELLKNIKPNLDTKNLAGEINTNLIKTIKKALKKSLQYIKVEGEEDLATAALILMLPLYSTIFYGQPDQGLVEVKVDEALKEKIFKILTN